MTLGVDAKSNSLIVAAPDYLFNEVKELVEHLDDIAVPADEIVRTVTLKRASSDLMQKSLAQRLGTSATIKSASIASTTTTTTRPASSSSSSSQSSSQQNDRGNERSRDDADQIRQRMDVFNALRGMQGGGGDSGRGGFSRGGFSGGFPGGFSGRGGFPGGGSFGGFSGRGGSDRGSSRGGDRGGRGR